MSSAHAVIIGIEKYYNMSIEGVDYARADALGFKDVLIKKLGVAVSNITLLLDQGAHKAEIEDKLKYIVGGLEEQDQFYFFYAGHGLWTAGTNRLTSVPCGR